MKKFLKSIFTILCLSLVALTASVFMLPNTENQTYAVDDNMHTVNFYNGNNLLYSINVNNNTSLQQLENNNILLNSNFADSTSTVWYEANSNTTLTYLDNGGLIIAGTSGSGYVGQHFINSTNYYGLNISFSISINNNIFSASGIVPNGYNGNGSTNVRILSINNVYDSTAVGVYIRPSGSIFCQFGVTSGNEYLVNWVKVEIGSSSTPYFSQEYISKLYRNNSDVSSNINILWSTAENVGQYNFETPITEDTNLYGFEDLTFNDNAEKLEAEVSYQPSYYLLEKAINNIEYIHYKGAYNFKVSIDTSKLTQQVPFLYLLTSVNIASLDTSNTNNQQTYLSSMSLSYIGNYDFDILNFRVIGGDNPILCVLAQSLGVPLYRFYLRQNVGIVDFYFSQASITYNSSSNNYVYDDNIDKYVFYNGTDLNDMNSNTNYFLSLDNVEDYSYYQTFLDLLSGETPSVYMYYSEDKFNDTDKYLSLYVNQSNTSYSYDIYKSDLNDNMVYISQFSLIFDDNDVTSEFYATLPENCFTFDSGFSFTQFDIVVRKPVARVDNSLVIFNFGYNNFLNAVTQVKYELRRGINYYDVVYNGQLENSKMIVIDNEFVRNSLFDEYIFVSFLIDVDNLSSSDVVNGQIGTYLGFDFNFVYYTQPLIANNSSYDLMQYKPEYMDATPSLIPLVLPVNAWAYNIIIFFVFYCPLISDILEFLHLNYFIGALVEILNLYLTSGIGQFVLACLSFILFWFILKSLMPIAFNGLRSSVRTYRDNQADEAEKSYKAAVKKYNLQHNNSMLPILRGKRVKGFKYNKGMYKIKNSNGTYDIHNMRKLRNLNGRVLGKQRRKLINSMRRITGGNAYNHSKKR